MMLIIYLELQVCLKFNINMFLLESLLFLSILLHPRPPPPLSPFPLSADVCCGKGRGLQLFPPWVLHHWFHIRSRRTSVSGQALVHVLSTSTNNDLCLCTVVGFSFLLHQENVYLKPHLCVVFLSYLFQHTVAFYYFVWDQTLNICNTG